MLITILPYTDRSSGSNRAHFQSSPCLAHPPKLHAIMNYLLGAGIKLHRLTDRQLCSMLVFLCHNVVPRIPTVNVMNNFDPLLLRIIAMPSCSPPRIFLWHLFRCSLRTFQLSSAFFEMHGSRRAWRHHAGAHCSSPMRVTCWWYGSLRHVRVWSERSCAIRREWKISISPASTSGQCMFCRHSGNLAFVFQPQLWFSVVLNSAA